MPAPDLRASGVPSSTRLLLVGAGHAHVEVLRRLALERPAGLAVTIVSPQAEHPYTGMLTGYVAGEYALEELLLPVEALAERAGATFVRDRAVRLRHADRVAELAGGSRMSYEVVSLDVGSTVAGLELPGVRRHALPVKPLESVVTLGESIARAPQGAHVLVVGGGAAGVELALTVAAGLERRGREAEVVLLEEHGRLLPEFSAGTSELARRILRRRGIAARTRVRVTAVEAGRAFDTAGDVWPHDVLVWATGPAAPELFRVSDLPTDPAGYLLVGSDLQAVGRPGVFGAGDCVALAGKPWVAKAGVHAVREAPVLWKSLRGTLLGGGPASYRPRRRYLWILNTGDGRGLLGWGRMAAHARWARVLKDRLDRRFMLRYLRAAGRAPPARRA